MSPQRPLRSLLALAGLAVIGACGVDPVPLAVGRLRVRANTSNQLDYAVETADGRYVRLDTRALDVADQDGIDWRTAGGSPVEVFGALAPDGAIAVSDLRAPESDDDTGQVEAGLVTRDAVKILVLRVTFDGGSTMGTAADAQALMNTAVQFWNEASFGKVQVSFDIAGPYNIAFNSCNDDWRWMSDATAAARAAGIDTSKYQHFMMLGNQNCGYGGLGEQPGVNTWVAGLWPSVVVHELGHNFGLWHASARTCTSGGATVTMSDTCTYAEYGDPFDPMGQGWPHHYSATNKAFLGWLPPENVVTATGDMVYHLAPSTLPATGLQLIHVRGANGTLYDLEYRRSASFDTYGAGDPVANGVSVRAMFTSAGDANRTHLVDLSPDGNFSNSALAVGASHTFFGTSTTLKVIAADATGATLQLTGAGAAPVGERLRFVGSGKCLSLASGSGDNGTAVVQRGCVGATDQMWTLTDSGAGDGSYTIRNATGARCLDVSGGSTTAGAPFLLWDCNGGTNQRWRVVTSSTGATLVSVRSGLCAGPAGGNTGDGAAVVQNACSGAATQNVSRGGAEKLIAAHSGKCIGPASASTADGAAIVQGTCAGTSAQGWVFESLGGGAYGVRNALSGKCLDVSGVSKATGAKVVQWTCSGADNQRWTLAASGSGYALKALHSGLCLDVNGVSTADGAPLIQWTCGGQLNQQFARQ